MKKELTLYNAYMECSRLWFWRAANPNKTKFDWPGWKKYKEKYGELQTCHWCPCCDYQRKTKREERFTFHCKTDCLPKVWHGCMDGNSPYYLFNSEHPEFALIIARGARDAAREIKNG